MEMLEINFATMARLADGLKSRGGTFEQFDGIVFDLIEEALFEAEAGRFARLIWEGKEISECEDCQEWSAFLEIHEENGLNLCRNCIEMEG
jgi:formylmethanofuran dehydrogenase subunit E